MSNPWDNLIMSLIHVTKLDLDSMIASLLLEESRRKSLEKPTSSSRVQALVSEGSKGKTRNLDIGDIDNGNFKPRSDIKCFYGDKVGHIKKNYLKHKRKHQKYKKNNWDMREKEVSVWLTVIMI